MRARIASSLLLLLGTACGGDPGEYRVVVRVPGGIERAQRIELSVLGSCAEVPDPGDEPVEVLLRVWAIDGEAETLGTLVEGRYGLYGRAWDGECRLYAAGCDAFVIEGGGEGTIEVILGELESPRSCPDGWICAEGQCREPGAEACNDAAAEQCALECDPCEGAACDECLCDCLRDCPQSEYYCE